MSTLPSIPSHTRAITKIDKFSVYFSRSTANVAINLDILKINTFFLFLNYLTSMEKIVCTSEDTLFVGSLNEEKIL